MSYDAKCYTLAGYFLKDFVIPDADLMTCQHILAQTIQDAIEEFIADEGLKEKP